ncbi:carboxyl transferase domain-containing protein [Rhizohabitans arisaemae]|uniref:carboxyl transferase domain-containing protein n=1 Tax=Rhizohabitans arisaemae TaxID=2720610 RepID=UPI0024B1A3A6|nr:carboxyl transferase domain-containing protein [Rhizohabitans arisaemae]
MSRVGARDLLRAVLDEDTFVSWDAPPVDVHPGPAYAAALTDAAKRVGTDESVITGSGLLRGRRTAVIVSEFGFLGGSIGVAAAERLTAAVERATAERLPLLVAPASGGTRMQEGTVAFLQMLKITQAVVAHKAAGLPYLVYLRHPTTGGVLASWGSLGHLTLAEPGALIGFLGPRVYEALHGAAFPEGVQTAENLHAHGLVDLIVAPGSLAGVVDRTLTLLAATGVAAGPAAEPAPAREATAWESVLATRDPGRPGARDLLRSATEVISLGDAGLILALARFGTASCVFLGQDRTGPPLGPLALRRARRGMRLAAELRLPLVTVIDTAGAELSQAAEEAGLAREIALCLAELLTLPTPTVSVLLGQGAGGGALAMLPADRVVAAQHGWLAPLPPEGASAIVHRDPGRAAELAGAQGIRSVDLAAAGAVDTVLPECGDAAGRPEAFRRLLADTLERELAQLRRTDPHALGLRRRHRHRTLGRPG